MFNRSVISLVLFGAVAVGQTDPAAAKRTLSRYFPAQVGMSWTYERLAPTASGSTEESYVKCVRVDTCDGERTATMRQVYFLGSVKTTTSIVYAYATSGRKLYKNESHNDVTGSQRYIDRPVVIKMPVQEESATWSSEEMDDDGAVTFVEEYSAHVVPICSTAVRPYRNVLMIAKRLYCNAGTESANRAERLGLVPEGFSRKKTGKALLGSERSYYALDIGLVKHLTFDRDGVLCGPTSSQLTQFSSQ